MDEVVAVAGIQPQGRHPAPAPGARGVTGPEVAAAAEVLWQASGRSGAHRLHPFVSELLDRVTQFGELTLAPEVVLGVLFFLVLVVAFAWLVLQGRAYGGLLGFFLIPIVIVGFPSIKSVQFSNGVFKVEKLTHDLQRDPTNKTLRDKLASELAGISPRPSTDPAVIATIARAQISLGKHGEAQARINNALRLAPRNAQVLELQRRLELDKKLTDLATAVEQDPLNNAAREDLRKIVAEASGRPIASPVTIINIARAQKAIGDHMQARANVERALKIDPNLAQAIELKSKMGLQ